jgi:tripartite ATP-independent transporter DctP family solute receptor
MVMKKIVSFILAVTLVLTLSACGGKPTANESSTTTPGAPTPPKQKVLQIGFATAAIETDPYNVVAVTFKKLVEERTNGAIRVDIYGGSQLGGEREMIESVQVGNLDMTVTTNALCSNIVPASGLFDLPFIFPDSETAAKIIDGPVGTAVLEEYSNYNMKALAWGEGGFRHLVLKSTPVRNPDDMKGLKIRCMETQSYIDAYKFMGSNAVPMDWPEVITALQQGTIDGLDIPTSVIYSNGFPDVAQYLALTGHFYSPLPILISNDAWDDLTPEQQVILQQAAKEAGQESRDSNATLETKLLKEMEDMGMKIISDVDIPAFQANFTEYYLDRKDQIGGTFVEDLLASLKS